MSGRIITEGDRVLKADIARNTFNIDGSRVKIGIISTSFNVRDSFQVLKDLKSANIADDEGRISAQKPLGTIRQ